MEHAFLTHLANNGVQTIKDMAMPRTRTGPASTREWLTAPATYE